MNKAFAILCLLGAIGAFGLASRDSFKGGVSFSKYGRPVGAERTLEVTAFDRIGFVTVGIFCVVGFGCFVRQARSEDVR